MCVTASRSRGSRFQVLGQATSWPGHVTAARRTGGPSKTVGAQEARLMVVRRHGCYYHPFLHSIGDHAPSRAGSMIRSFALISNNRVGGGENGKKEWKEVLPITIPDDLGNALGLRVPSDASFAVSYGDPCNRVIALHPKDTV